VFQVEFGYARAGDRGGAGEEDCASRTSVIHNSQDGVVPIAVWEPRDQIHCYMGKWFGVNFGWDSE
jgi:hypothetical protein